MNHFEQIDLLIEKHGVQVYTVKRELHGIGIITAKTPFGHTVPVYDIERTICDLLRSRSRTEIQVFQDVLKQNPLSLSSFSSGPHTFHGFMWIVLEDLKHLIAPSLISVHERLPVLSRLP